jgi:hypothetical protein
MRAFHTRSSSGASAANPAALEGRRDASVGRRGSAAVAVAAAADAGRALEAFDFAAEKKAFDFGVASTLSLSRRAPRAALRSARRRAEALCVLNARSSASIAPIFDEARASVKSRASKSPPPRGATRTSPATLSFAKTDASFSSTNSASNVSPSESHPSLGRAELS